jgi:hypothetical protein
MYLGDTFRAQKLPLMLVKISKFWNLLAQNQVKGSFRLFVSKFSQEVGHEPYYWTKNHHYMWMHKFLSNKFNFLIQALCFIFNIHLLIKYLLTISCMRYNFVVLGILVTVSGDGIFWPETTKTRLNKMLWTCRPVWLGLQPELKGERTNRETRRLSEQRVGMLL